MRLPASVFIAIALLLLACAGVVAGADEPARPAPPDDGPHVFRVGDRLVTSGIGGRFPAGFPVGVVQSLHPDDTRLFVVAEAVFALGLRRDLHAAIEQRAGPVRQRAPAGRGAARS